MSKVLSYVSPQYSTTTIIASGQTQSAAIDLTNNTLVGVYIPTFTGTTMTFQTAPSATGSYVAMVDGAGNAVSKTVASSQYLVLDPNVFAGVRYLKISSGSSEGADRTLTLAIRPIT